MLIISHKSSLEFKEFLDINNLTWIETIDNLNLDPRIADHPDLSIFTLEKDSLIVDENLIDYYKKHIRFSNIMPGEAVGASYPYDSIYNLYKISNYYIHNDVTEKNIDIFMKENNYKHLFVKQGYTRCSIIPMKDKILTSDYGIYKSLKEKIDVVLLEDDNVAIDGFSKGFLGGCCGFFENTLLFNGNIEKLKSYEIIKKEALRSGIKLLYPSCDLIDTGSILYCN